MNEFRVFVAVIVFFISTCLSYDLYASGFSFTVLIASFLGYISVHYIWPKTKADESAWYDMLEVVLDLPYRVIATILRSIGGFEKLRWRYWSRPLKTDQ